MQQQPIQHQPVATIRPIKYLNNNYRKRRPIDRQLPRKLETYIPESETFAQLVRYENKLDAIISRKKLDLQETAIKSLKQKRTLRVFISNFSSDQYEQVNTLDNSIVGDGVPSWTLRIEGRLLDPVNGRKQPGASPKFSSFVKAVYIELQRDPQVYPEGNIIEWHKQIGAQECDGFEVKRVGDTLVPAKIMIHLDNAPEKYKLRSDLARALDIHTESKPNILLALWQYIKVNKLQDQDDKKCVNLDETLQKVFGCKPKIEFSMLSELLTGCLLPPDPVVIDYVINVDKEYSLNKFAHDIEVEVNDPMRFKINSLMGGNSELAKEINTLEEKISAVVHAIHLSKTKRDFMLAFSKDPVSFLDQFLASQSRDMELIMGDIHVNREECRRGDFWTGDWVNEAIVHYLQNK